MTIMKINSKLKLLFFSFLFGFHLIGYGQHLDEELKLKLSAMERKRLEKSDEQYRLAIKNEEVANNILKIKSTSTNIDKLSLRKKYNSKRLNAATYYFIANSTKIDVYHTAIKNFQKNFKGDKSPLNFIHSIENMANDSLAKASDFRYNANKSENLFDKLDLILQAELMETRFIPVLGKVLFSYISYPIQYDNKWLISYNSDLPGEITHIITDTTKVKNPVKKDTLKHSNIQDSTIKRNVDTIKNETIKNETIENKSNIQFNQFESNDSSLYGKIAVGENQIDSFNNFLKKQYPSNYKNYIINFQELNYSDVNSLREAWYKYMYGYSMEDSNKIVNQKNKSTQMIDSAEKSKLAVNSSLVDTSGIKVNKGHKNKKFNKQHFNDSIKINNTDSAEFIFKVQIAACRVHMDENTLKGIYNGSEKIIELYEDNWYKYVISQSTTYSAARKIRDKIKVQGAFVIAYLNGTRIKITPAIVISKR